MTSLQVRHPAVIQLSAFRKTSPTAMTQNWQKKVRTGTAATPTLYLTHTCTQYFLLGLEQNDLRTIPPSRNIWNILIAVTCGKFLTGGSAYCVCVCLPQAQKYDEGSYPSGVSLQQQLRRLVRRGKEWVTFSEPCCCVRWDWRISSGSNAPWGLVYNSGFMHICIVPRTVRSTGKVKKTKNALKKSQFRHVDSQLVSHSGVLNQNKGSVTLDT